MHRPVWILLGLLMAGVVWGSVADDWRLAIGKRDVASLERLLPSAADVNVTTEDGTTALMLAAKAGRSGLVSSLLRAGARVNATNSRGGTALMYAAITGDQETLQTLLDSGGLVNAQSSNGWTAIMIASVKGHEAAAKLLLDRGADPNLSDIYGWTPLMRAVYGGRTGIVQVLLKRESIDVNARDETGATALHHAAARGDAETARLLIQHGADMECTSRDGLTPLMVAVSGGHEGVAEEIRSALDR